MNHLQSSGNFNQESGEQVDKTSHDPRKYFEFISRKVALSFDYRFCLKLTTTFTGNLIKDLIKFPGTFAFRVVIRAISREKFPRRRHLSLPTLFITLAGRVKVRLDLSSFH